MIQVMETGFFFDKLQREVAAYSYFKGRDCDEKLPDRTQPVQFSRVLVLEFGRIGCDCHAHTGKQCAELFAFRGGVLGCAPRLGHQLSRCAFCRHGAELAGRGGFCGI